jgi:curli biogenesis system outer membrane secretion channel CsgG
MKKLIHASFILTLLLGFHYFGFSQKFSIQEVQEQCAGLKQNEKVRVSVAGFMVTNQNTMSSVATELTEMLTNAMQNVNCFNVLLSIGQTGILTEEIIFAQSGNTAAGTGPQTAKMKGPQVIVVGKITDFSPGLGDPSSFGGNKARVSFILQLINAETREIIESKSFKVEGKSNILNFSSSNKSLADVCEKAINQSVEFIASRKAKMPLPDAQNPEMKVYNATNCSVLNSEYVPKVMVILPEFHISQRIPDPAAETEINRKLIEAGFKVVDAAMFATIKNGARFADAAKDPKLAISLGREFGADIVVYGEAFSQRTGTQGAQVTCRARVEIKAVRTDDASILISNGLEAGALDNAEFVAAKSALRSAGTLVADYMLEQFCSKGLSFSKPTTTNATVKTGNEAMNIQVKNVDFAKFKALTDLLATKGKILDKSLVQGNGSVALQTSMTSDGIAELISKRLGAKYEIQELSKTIIVLQYK